MGHVGSKLGHWFKFFFKTCSPSKGHSFCFNLHETTPECVFMISWSSSNMGHVGSKTRSLGQISLKSWSAC